MQLRVLERARAKLSLAELASHQEHGVDNTGNVRVWPAEQIILHVVLGAWWRGRGRGGGGGGGNGAAGVGAGTAAPEESRAGKAPALLLPAALCGGARGLAGRCWSWEEA